MSVDVSSELETLATITDMANLKARRAAKRGAITKAFKTLEKFYGIPLSAVKVGEWGRKAAVAFSLIKVHSFIAERMVILLTTALEAANERDRPARQSALDEMESQQELYENSIEDKEDEAQQMSEILVIYTDGQNLLNLAEAARIRQDTGCFMKQEELTQLNEQVADHKRRALAEGAARADLEKQTQAIANLVRGLTEAPSTTTPTPVSTSVFSAASSIRRTAKNIDLPEFNGDVLTWEPFWEVYQARMIEEKDTSLWELITATTKCLKDSAAKNIFVSASMGGQLKRGQDALLAEYGDPKRLYKVYVTKLTNTLVGTHYSDSHASLTTFKRDYDDVERGMNHCKGYSIEQLLGALAEKAMDKALSRKWREHSSSISSPPTLTDVKAFIEQRLKANSEEHQLIPDMLASGRARNAPTQNKPEVPPERKRHIHVLQPQESRSSGRRTLTGGCGHCGSTSHKIYSCDTFKSMTVEQRKGIIAQKGLCYNCMGGGHSASACRSTSTCRTCGGRHHSMLHLVSNHAPTGTPPQAATQVQSAPSPSPQLSVVQVLSTNKSNPSPADVRVCPTAQMEIRSGGRSLQGRGFLDGGATDNLVTNSLVKRLKAKTEKSGLSFEALGIQIVDSGFLVQLSIGCVDGTGDFISIRASVVENICSPLPSYDYGPLLADPWVTGKRLADQGTGYRPIDLLLSHTDYARCQRGAHQVRAEQGVTFTGTVFGLVIGGAIPASTHAEGIPPTVPTLLCTSADKPTTKELDQQLIRFWECEKLPGDELQASELEQNAINHFRDTHTRSEDGRYHVSLPRVANSPLLGDSRTMALNRYLSNERSLKKKGQLQPYLDVLREYLTLNHAEIVPESELLGDQQGIYYLATFGVVKESSSTTKLRVVFDASAPTTSGVSLNDLLLKGPNRYPKLSTIINLFRSKAVAMSADISKMFREVGLHSSDRDLHRFLMRGEDGIIRDYRMKRVAFGVKSSPFLATETLLQMARDHHLELPIGAHIISKHFYVDDCLVSFDTLQEATVAREELNRLLLKGGMILRKWRSNSTELLATIPSALQAEGGLEIVTATEDCPRALGMLWNVVDDTLSIPIPNIIQKQNVTKREVVSGVARTYDNLGWVAATTVTMKILLQSVWKSKVGWDDKIAKELYDIWEKWRTQLPLLGKEQIPRSFVQHASTAVTVQLHGFSDASLHAYGAVVYVRTFHEDTQVSIRLVTAKSKVTPLSTPSTIPRLELCGAVLLAELMVTVATDLNIPISSAFCWCDSAVVLGWVNSAHKFRAYVSRRVGLIISNIPANQWRYVHTSVNPADLVSRGIMPEVLTASQLWWQGPPWLKEDPDLWPRHPSINLERELPEHKALIAIANAIELQVTPKANPSNQQGNLAPSTHPLEIWISSYSSISRLLRTSGWIFRFIRNCKIKDYSKRERKHELTTQELFNAEVNLQRQVQYIHYQNTVDSIKEGKTLSKSNSLLLYNPMLGPKGLLRIGGRLGNAPLEYRQQHPVIIPNKSWLALLLMRRVHYHTSHAGVSTMLSTLGQTVYIKAAKRIAKTVTRQCIICQKSHAKTGKQIMADLPISRVSQAPPFSVVGLDYAGPFMVRRGSPRKPTIIKAYACVFTCFLTRAIHFEAVSDLSTEAFLACLNRFVNRRGCPAHIHSDNGTNFVGANRQLREAYQLLHDDATKRQIHLLAQEKGIQWSFSPSRSPHHGGLWEAGVKCMKTILHKLLGAHSYTFEELQTIMTEAEST